MSLSDLPGIGKKTAEKLKDKGIETQEELGKALARGDETLREFSSRVQSAAREAQEGDVTVDRLAGVRIDDENERAVEVFESQEAFAGTDQGAITRNNSDLQGSMLDLGRQAAEGQLLASMRKTPSQDDISDTIDDREKKERRQKRRNIAEMGFDAAANISAFDRETIEEANERAEKATGATRRDPKTGFTKTVTREIIDEEKEFEKDVRVNPREFAAAKRTHQARSADAKRVDNRRRAELEDDFDKWVKAPSQSDFPGVDTPQRGGAVKGFGAPSDSPEQTVEATAAPTGGFQVRETSADGSGGGRVSTAASEILSAPQEQQKVILGDLIPTGDEADEIGLQPRGPDKEFFAEPEEGGGFIR